MLMIIIIIIINQSNSYESCKIDNLLLVIVSPCDYGLSSLNTHNIFENFIPLIFPCLHSVFKMCLVWSDHKWIHSLEPFAKAVCDTFDHIWMYVTSKVT